MKLAFQILVSLVAISHFYFLYLEMFLGTTPKGLKIFGQTLQQATSSKTLAANQGLYNGFLAAGLLWSLIDNRQDVSMTMSIYVLLCVIVAGMYGGFTVNRRIFFIQSLPAVAALAIGLSL